MYGVSVDTTSHNDIEKYRLDTVRKRNHLGDIKKFPGVEELAILTSSNRTEYYLNVDETTFKHGDLLRYLSQFTDKPLNEIILETYSKFNEDVINHLYTLTSGMLLDSQNISDSLNDTENALLLAIDEATAGKVLVELFNNAIEYVLTIQADSAVAPIRQGYPSELFNLLEMNLSQIEGKNIVLLGENKDILYLSKQLIFSGAQSVTISTENVNFNAHLSANLNDCSTIPAIRRVLKDIHVVGVDESTYRISASDVVVLLSETDQLTNYQSSVEEIDNIRMTKKRQVVLDLSEQRNRQIYLNHSIIDYLDGIKTSYKNFTDNEIEHASNFFEESLEVASKKFMESYSFLNQKVRMDNHLS